MTAARLEELAVWAGSVASQHEQLGQAKLRDIYADLARCARAWATVERILVTDTDIELARCYGGEIRIRLNDVKSTEWGPTAIEAAEAAGEVTDANKG